MPKSNSSKKAILKQLRTQVPFARGFQSPTSGEQISAIGFKPNELPIEYTDAASKKFFHPISQPTSVDDWLAQYAEEGQSFRNHAKTKHVQIQVDSILSKLKLIIPKDAFCLIGLTPFDLYGDESDLFVAGMAAGNQQVAVFSLMRYNPALTFSSENWFDIQEDPSILPAEKQHLIFQRSCKLVVHEICHLLGLPHCVYFQCCMNGSGHLKEDFSQPMMLCPVDLHKLQALIGFDVLERYKSLLHFYRAHQFISEAEWTERRIKYLKAG